MSFCNDLSTQRGLTPAYRIDRAPVEPAPQWAPHHRPAPDDVLVTWDAAADGYRLPTEAERELACPAGTTGPRYGPLDDVGWYHANSGERPHPVAAKEANA